MVSAETVLIVLILILSLLGVIFLTLFVYYGRRKVLCEISSRPWCWTDWTCPDQPEGSKKRCPVLPTQELAQSCETTSGAPGCGDAWESNNNVVEEMEIPYFAVVSLNDLKVSYF